MIVSFDSIKGGGIWVVDEWVEPMFEEGQFRD
jgi:hypothetical protein